MTSTCAWAMERGWAVIKAMTVIINRDDGRDLYLDKVFGFAKCGDSVQVAYCDGREEFYKGTVSHARLMNYQSQEEGE